MDEQHLQHELKGGIATLTLNRPDVLNALSDQMIALLLDAIVRYDADPAVGAIVITGAGRGFCAGGDVKGMAAGGDLDAHQRLERMRRMHQVPMALAQCSKVTIARINGPAMGAGLGIALGCDFRLAARSARFGAAFVRIGLVTDFGVGWHLPRIVGQPLAREMILTGEPLDSATALQVGLVTRVVDDAELDALTASWAARFAAGPALAYRYLKRNLAASDGGSLQEVLDMEAIHQVTVAASEDHREAARAFVEKRPPVFKGR